MNKPVLILILSLNYIAFGQNLVPNPSFEEYTECPDWEEFDKVAEWFVPTDASSDYYNACSLGGVGVPQNNFGYQYAHTGEAYSGIVTFNVPLGTESYREYIEIKLKEPLTIGEKYYWSMYVSLIDSVDLASNNIGILLTEEPVYDLGGYEVINMDPTGNYNQIITDDVNWTLIKGTFIAESQEEYLTIGNFLTDEETDTVRTTIGQVGDDEHPYAYYYIDDVCISAKPCVEPSIEIPNIFSPNNDGINDILTFKELVGVYDYTISIFNRWGTRVYQAKNTFQWDGKSSTDSFVASGVYFYSLEYNENNNKTGFVHVIR